VVHRLFPEIKSIEPIAARGQAVADFGLCFAQWIFPLGIIGEPLAFPSPSGDNSLVDFGWPGYLNGLFSA